jgi:hypothetical protein
MSKAIRQFLNKTDEGQEQVTTIRPSATALFAIDSDDRYENYSVRRTNPTYPFTFAIQKNEALLNGFFKRMALTEFRMNWTLPNVSKAWGNNEMVIYWNTNALPLVVNTNTITPADSFYSTELMASELQQQIRSIAGLEKFIVNVTVTENDDFMIFTAPSGVNFTLGPVLASANIRQLIDMLNVPYPWTSSTAPLNANLVTSITTGIPNMRATDYIDITSPQLTYNMDLKDTSSAKIVRDMIARIYLDDPVPSQSQVNVNYYANTPDVGSNFVTAFTAVAGVAGAGTGNVAVFTMTPKAEAYVGQTVYIRVVVATVPTASILNGSAKIVAIDATTITVEYPYTLGTIVTTTGSMYGYNPQEMVSVSQGSWDDNVNGVSPFVLYRQFPYPKQIRWNKDMPIGNITFEMFDDQGRSIQNLWSSTYPTTSTTFPQGRQYANSFSWNASILVSED